ncbi:hypothetical protein AN642_01255 [Epulopiscium sp. SCG-B10WGA-EpuloA2]|nr:hypothetical protein AN642_01255 [Epulopiscium sp. SCG-B10WGA-EpuloA2]
MEDFQRRCCRQGWQTPRRRVAACLCEEEQRRPAERASPERTHRRMDRNSEDGANAPSSPG